MTPVLTSIDFRLLDQVLQMGGGYVLDFNNDSYSRFFRSHRIDIDDPRYAIQGGSKAKRLRCFLEGAPKHLVAGVVSDLFQHRLSLSEPLNEETRHAMLDLLHRLDPSKHSAPQSQTAASAVETLLAKTFDPSMFHKLPVGPGVADLLIARMREAQSCTENASYLAAVILSGSALEGMCLGYGTKHPAEVNRAFTEQFNKSPPPFWDWKLGQWIDVLTRLGVLTQNISKFGHAVRDFRNYVHPSEQLANNFTPDQRTAQLSFHVVLAAAEDLLMSERERAQ